MPRIRAPIRYLLSFPFLVSSVFLYVHPRFSSLSLSLVLWSSPLSFYQTFFLSLRTISFSRSLSRPRNLAVLVSRGVSYTTHSQVPLPYAGPYLRPLLLPLSRWYILVCLYETWTSRATRLMRFLMPGLTCQPMSSCGTIVRNTIELIELTLCRHVAEELFGFGVEIGIGKCWSRDVS